MHQNLKPDFDTFKEFYRIFKGLIKLKILLKKIARTKFTAQWKRGKKKKKTNCLQGKKAIDTVAKFCVVI